MLPLPLDKPLNDAAAGGGMSPVPLPILVLCGAKAQRLPW